jgi:hypothetical protein
MLFSIPWISKNWLQKVMLGAGPSAHKGPLLHQLLKLRLGSMIYLSTTEEKKQLNSKSSKSSDPCPQFIRAGFQHSVFSNERNQLKELFLICDRNNLDIPGELLPDVWRMYDDKVSFRDLYLRMLQSHLEFLGEYFEEYRLFKDCAAANDWEELTLSDKKHHLQSRFAWSKSLQPFQWIESLPSNERVVLLKDNLFHEWPDRIKLAIDWADSRSKKANRIARVYLLRDKDQELYKTALNYIKDCISAETGLIVQDGQALPFEIMEAEIVKDTATPILPLVAWLDPEDIFQHLDIEGRELSEALMNLDENEAWVASLLHAAIYHNNEQWIKYALEMVIYYDLVRVKYHDHWPKMLQRINPTIVKEAFQKAMRKAKNDLDRLDAIQHWLFAADLFISKDLSQKIWSTIETGLELITYGELSLDHYKDLFTYIQNRIHPSVAKGWEGLSKSNGFSANLRKEVKRRFFLYKSLNQWLKARQNN